MDRSNLSDILALSVFILFSGLGSAEAGTAAEPGHAMPQPAQTRNLEDSMGSAVAAQFTETVESRYFIFYSTIPRARLQEYAHFADLFLDLVDRDFIKLRVAQRVNAVVLPNKAEFQRFLIKQLRVRKPSEYGMYLGDKNLFVTYDGSGLGTFSHEIMHYVIDTMLPECPAWAIEGIPAFFEKFYGYEENGQLQLKWGYQNPWRIQAMGERVPRLKLRTVLYGSDDTSEKRLLSVFLYQQGKLQTFLDLVRQADKKGFRTYVEAAFAKPLYEIEGEWQAYLNAIHANRDKIYQLPLSMYFPAAHEFAVFERENSAVLQ
ncbi:MAG: hypothetical protein A2V90_04360 [Gammaproteobacteria bacterium RBG_16_57_12]|nr:MAG: hypothetical protein A2V90_04360 [Gammaproteobacteria bacterium RBG_16_57_12]